MCPNYHHRRHFLPILHRHLLNHYYLLQLNRYYLIQLNHYYLIHLKYSFPIQRFLHYHLSHFIYYHFSPMLIIIFDEFRNHNGLYDACSLGSIQSIYQYHSSSSFQSTQFVILAHVVYIWSFVTSKNWYLKSHSIRCSQLRILCNYFRIKNNLADIHDKFMGFSYRKQNKHLLNICVSMPH